jgi:hypothetical protein
MDEPVVVTTVTDEREANVVCGLLRSAGLECGFRPTAASDSEFLFGGGLVKHPAGSLLAGRMEILVHAPDLEAAREVIAADDSL